MLRNAWTKVYAWLIERFDEVKFGITHPIVVITWFLEGARPPRPTPELDPLDPTQDEFRGDIYVTGMGQKLRVHAPDQCATEHCVIHNPSDHHMRDWPTNWRDGGMFDIKPPHMERICPHGIGHPDPDNLGADELSIHGCDGCCTKQGPPAPSVDVIGDRVVITRERTPHAGLIRNPGFEESPSGWTGNRGKPTRS